MIRQLHTLTADPLALGSHASGTKLAPKAR